MRLPLTQSLLPHKPGVHQELNFLNPKRSQVTVRYVLNPNQLKNKHQLHQTQKYVDVDKSTSTESLLPYKRRDHQNLNSNQSKGFHLAS